MTIGDATVGDGLNAGTANAILTTATTTAGDVTQTATGVISAGGLSIDTSTGAKLGNIKLATATNLVGPSNGAGSFAAKTEGGTVSFSDGSLGTLTIGAVTGGVAGINTTVGAAAGAAVAINAHGQLTATSTINGGTGGIVVYAPDPVSHIQLATVAGADPNTMYITQALLNATTAASVQIGNTAFTGDIEIASTMTTGTGSFNNTLTLVTGELQVSGLPMHLPWHPAHLFLALPRAVP